MYEISARISGLWDNYAHKLLCILKITTIILLVSISPLQASNVFGQRINYVQKQVSLEQIFKEIKKQTNYNIVWFEDNLNPKATQDVNFRNAAIEEVMDQILCNQSARYEIKNKTIVIKSKVPSTSEKLKKTILNFFETFIDVTGKVVDERGEPLLSAVVKVAGTNQTALTDNGGVFTLVLPKGKYSLVVSYLTHKIKRVDIEVPLKDKLLIAIEPEDRQLKEVEIVSTGYQSLPKERATGSFEVVDNKLFNRSTGTDVFSRLDGVTTGTLFDKSNATLLTTPYEGLNIRGLSGVKGARRPLIVLDNFPYDGDPNNLNPNDVESVTLLKDAAAASIWGSQSGNGVIVITTKKGRFNQPFQLNFNTNLTLTDKPDLNYLKTLKSSDYIDVEKMLFSKGFYNGSLNPLYPYRCLTPVVELLAKQSAGEISEKDANDLIDSWRTLDVRKDFLKYVYRVATKQQYAVNLNGGTDKINYLFSAGYDKNLYNLKTSNYNRKTFRLNTSIKPVKNLEIETGMIYAGTTQRETSSASNIEYGSIYLFSDQALYPYARLADDGGNPLVIPKGLRSSFKDTVGSGILQDWSFRPLNEMNNSFNIVKATDVLLNIGAKYTISSVLNGEIKYQYEHGNSARDDRYGKNSYYTRDYVNMYTQFQNGAITAQPIPSGDIVNRFNGELSAQVLRGQLNLNKTWGAKHQLNMIAGSEIRENINKSSGSIIYGYNDETLTSQNVDFVHNYPLLNGALGNSSIPSIDSYSLSEFTNRFVSIFTNAAYVYDNRYVISLSARKDEANLFGLATNAKGLPLWSAGASWNVSNEHFYKSEILPFLKLRTTFGYSGNVDNSVPAFATISYSAGTSPTNFPYASGDNPPNSRLRFEKIGMLNLGLDFAFKNNIICGSFEYYNKTSKDLLASAPVDPSTGFQTLVYNSAILKGKGIDAHLNAKTLNLNAFKVETNLLFSYNKSIVDRYLLGQRPASEYVTNSGAVNPVEGQNVSSMYAFKFVGLDHETGNPIGVVNGEQTMDYNSIIYNSKIADLQNFGSSRPLYFGAFRNTIDYKGLSLSVNISYRFAYYFRRIGLDYYDLFDGGVSSTDFEKRWIKPGDEKITNVPSMIYDHPNQYNRGQFYVFSGALIEKGDNIRLEDINLSYTFKLPGRGIKSLRVYANANNLGILWRANKLGLDPDYGSGTSQIPPSRTIVCGASINF